jgi:hypothetical protein
MKRYIFIVLIVTPLSVIAQEVEDAAKAAQNPLTNVISMPLQNNNDFGIGNYDKSAYASN